MGHDLKQIMPHRANHVPLSKGMHLNNLCFLTGLQHQVCRLVLLIIGKHIYDSNLIINYPYSYEGPYIQGF